MAEESSPTFAFSHRLAQETDFDFVHNGKLDIFKLENIPGDKIDPAEERRLTQNCIKNQTVIIAEHKNVPIGYIWFEIGDKVPYGVEYGSYGKQFAWVSFVYVLSEWRRRGVGTYLYEVLEKYCKEKGITEILLDVFCCNPRSEQFHEKLGYKAFLKIYSKELKSVTE